MKTRLQTILAFLAILFVQEANGQSPDDLFQQGNTAYMQGAYQEAIDLYESILDAGVEAAALYYNLGNAYFQLDMRGRARLNYERAKKLDPRNEAVRHNIELLRERIPGEAGPLPQPRILEVGNDLAGKQKADGWAWTAISLVLALSVSLAIVYITPSVTGKRLFLVLAAVFLLGVLVSLYAARKQYYSDYVLQASVVMEHSITARSAPGETGRDLITLSEGIKVEVNTRVESWAEIRLPDGNTGWVPEQSLEDI